MVVRLGMKKVIAVAIYTISLGSSFALANSEDTIEVLGDAGKLVQHDLGFDVGSMVAYPILSYAVGTSSSASATQIVTREGEFTGEFEPGSSESAIVSDWRVGGGLQGVNRGHLYGIEYVLEGGEYLSSGNDDDDVDQTITAYWGTAITPRHNFDASIRYSDSHDPRSEDDPLRNARRSNVSGRPDLWSELKYGFGYVYGVDGARGNIAVQACETDREYDNNDQSFRDRTITDIGGQITAQVAPKTQLFGQIVHSDFDYDNQSPTDPLMGESLSSTEKRYLVGAAWDATQRISGQLRVGQVEKDFDAATRTDYDALTLDAELNWTPTDRDQVTLYSFYAPRENVWFDGVVDSSDFVEVRQTELYWSRPFGNKLTAQLGGYFATDDYRGTAREDDRTGFSVAVRYSLNRFGDIGLTYYQRERDSDVAAREYDEEGLYLDLNIGALFGFGVNESRATQPCSLRSYTSEYNAY